MKLPDSPHDVGPGKFADVPSGVGAGSCSIVVRVEGGPGRLAEGVTSRVGAGSCNTVVTIDGTS